MGSVSVSGLEQSEAILTIVMRGLDPRIHVFLPSCCSKDVDGRVKPGHDDFFLD